VFPLPPPPRPHIPPPPPRSSGLGQLLRAGFVARGLCAVQDEATGLVVSLLAPAPGDSVLDACAAPGGKALYIADRLRGEGKLLAMDVSAPRLRALDAAARRLQSGPVLSTRAGDLRAYAASPDAETFDRVLLDAPCSGTGVVAKRADLRWRRTPEELAALVALQAALLDAAARLVKPGGLLVYSTCSLEAEENGAQAAAFLARHPHFALEPPPAGALPAEVLSPEGYLTLLPFRHGIDGAFAAALRRQK